MTDKKTPSPSPVKGEGKYVDPVKGEGKRKRIKEEGKRRRNRGRGKERSLPRRVRERRWRVLPSRERKRQESKLHQRSPLKKPRKTGAFLMISVYS